MSICRHLSVRIQIAYRCAAYTASIHQVVARGCCIEVYSCIHTCAYTAQHTHTHTQGLQICCMQPDFSAKAWLADVANKSGGEFSISDWLKEHESNSQSTSDWLKDHDNKFNLTAYLEAHVRSLIAACCLLLCPCIIYIYIYIHNICREFRVPGAQALVSPIKHTNDLLYAYKLVIYMCVYVYIYTYIIPLWVTSHRCAEYCGGVGVVKFSAIDHPKIVWLARASQG